VRIDNANAVCRCEQVSAGGHAGPARSANAYSCVHNCELLARRGWEGGREGGGKAAACGTNARDVSAAQRSAARGGSVLTENAAARDSLNDKQQG